MIPSGAGAGAGGGPGTGCEATRLSLGAFLLGALPPEECRQIRRHLTGCAGCRRESDELGAVTALLGLLSAQEAEAVASRPRPDGPAEAAAPEDAAAALHEFGRQRGHGRRRSPRPRPRSRRRLLLAIAAGLTVLAGAGGAAWSVTEARPPAPIHVATAVDRTTGVGASVSVQPADWGSRLALDLRNAPVGSSCSLVVVGWHGQHQVAASWTAKYRGDLRIPGAVAMSPGEIARFDVDTFDGHRLVSVPE